MSSEDSPESSGSSTPTSPSFDGTESEPDAEVVPSSPGVEPEPDTESCTQSEAGAEVGSIWGEGSGPSAGAESDEPSADSCEQSIASSDTEAESDMVLDEADLDVDTADSASEAAESTPATTAAKAELGMGATATATSATKKKITKVGKFASAFGTLAEHVASHDYPAHVATCGPCKFWRNRWKWSAEFSCLSPVSQKKETWLGCKSGFAICLLCSGAKIRADRPAYGRGT